MKDLYEYQKEFLNDIGKSFRTNKRVVAQAATGYGKTVVLSEIARRSIAKGNIVCIAVHRVELFEQTFKQLVSFGLTPGLIVAGKNPMQGAQVYLCMVESFHRKMNKGLIDKLNISFFILDECHLSNYTKIIKDLDAYILGFSATPKSSGNVELKDIYDDMVCSISVSELINVGRLVPARTFSIKHDWSKVKRKGKDYDEQAVVQEFKKPKLHTGAVDLYLKEAKGLKALCYCASVSHSNETVLQFRDSGVKAAHVDGTTDSETRNRLFQWLREGKLDVLSNVGIATTGTDIPEVQCVIKNFATMSLVKDVQVNGRGARSCDNKKEFIILDLGRNHIRHGIFGEDINWRHIFNHPSEAFKKESKKKTKRECSCCGFVMNFMNTTCPNCGTVTSQEKIEREMLTGCTIEEVREYRMQHLPIHLRIPVSQMNYEDLKNYAYHMNYNSKWIHVIMNNRRHR